ncbi:MAG: T9SS type A sorting domain-containing protein [Ignavibacteria bacterium]|nr:T9SS type A sorting domain-containing protein [Ignavibacteria bacterium]MBT8382248.1 T9SS type A sorting domain-containing protein [Ignavibacteria bacterium]MBT8390748.1 T9SS type A sorting domain-containing protein [Ignavibacteria bacterium]NNJ53417.1 T9SS type A sorting domain-containing protein [Ignavibacteriaceae bacterium]NNL22408.1 T9SS type A sorting domain-containing protein [Ignavibacteriaceae bacterium]
MKNLQKLYYLVLLLLFSVNIFSQNYWEKIASPTSNDLNTLFFIDSLSGYVAGDSGLILYTSNGGGSWIQQQSNTNRNIIDLFFLNENLGWAVAWSEGIFPFSTFILKTMDGGNNWDASQFRQDNVLMYAIYFLDSLTGFTGGNPGAIFKTTDGGVNWDSTEIANAPFAYFPILKFNFFNDDYGFACGGAHDIAGITWKTTNGGDFWEPIDTAYTPPDELWDIYFIDSANVIAAGGDPELFGVGLLRSTDAGATWSYDELGLIGMARAISFRTDYECWSPVPIPESIIESKDTGRTWIFYTAPENTSIYDLVFTDSLTGYGVGEQGAIIKYKYPIVPSVTNETTTLSKSFNLYQNFPNPFNPTTTIQYFIPVNGFVSLTVYDVLGNEIEMLVNNFQTSGNYEVNWNAAELPSGIYYYKLEVGNFTASKKMLLLH